MWKELMNSAHTHSVCFGLILLGFYVTYQAHHPGSDGAILSIFVAALAAFGGFQLGERVSRNRERDCR